MSQIHSEFLLLACQSELSDCYAVFVQDTDYSGLGDPKCFAYRCASFPSLRAAQDALNLRFSEPVLDLVWCGCGYGRLSSPGLGGLALLAKICLHRLH